LLLTVVTVRAMKSLGQEIKEFLQATGMSQGALAKAAGVPHPTISYLVTGRRKNVLGDTQDKLRAVMTMLWSAHEDSVPGKRDV